MGNVEPLLAGMRLGHHGSDLYCGGMMDPAFVFARRTIK
jgi:hypothetical protein